MSWFLLVPVLFLVLFIIGMRLCVRIDNEVFMLVVGLNAIGLLISAALSIERSFKHEPPVRVEIECICVDETKSAYVMVAEDQYFLNRNIKQAKLLEEGLIEPQLTYTRGINAWGFITTGKIYSIEYVPVQKKEEDSGKDTTGPK